MTLTQTDIKRTILNILLEHTSQENAITAAEIGYLCGLGRLKNTWPVRERINQLVKEDKVIICSNDKGYWLSDKWTDVNECCGQFHNRGLKNLEHEKDLREAFLMQQKVRLF